MLKEALQRYIGFLNYYKNSFSVQLDWQNDSIRFFNYSKPRMPNLKFRLPMT